MVAEADREDLVLGAEDLLQEELNILGVALEEFVLRVGAVDEQADAEREFGFAGEGDDLLRNSVFEYLEGVLIEAGDELAGGVVDAEGEGDEMDLGVEDGLLRFAGGCEKEQRKQSDSEVAKGSAAWVWSVHEASVNTLLWATEVPGNLG